MGYTSRTGRKPNEYASKSAHTHVVKDPSVQQFLQNCNLPKRSSGIVISSQNRFTFAPNQGSPLRHVIAIDGGYSEVPVQREFPSATICFFQFGALVFEIADLEEIEASRFIDPIDMEKLKRIQRIKLTLPVRNVTSKEESTLTNSIRSALYHFFRQDVDDGQLLDTLRWFIFREFDKPSDEYVLASCPECGVSPTVLSRKLMTPEGLFSCTKCSKRIYLTDVFRLHEAVDDEIGAGGILGYVTTAVEQLILVHFIHLILKTKPSLFKDILFIKDGPLAFFGQTANMFKPMRDLVRFLFAQHDLNLAGLEKSGPFVEHAHEIAPLLKPGEVLILDNDYIYKYIIPGKADPNNPYGRTTYYGNKIIFKSQGEKLYVITFPTEEVLPNPHRQDLHNLDQILTNIEKLNCDMYEDSLVPVALVNKLVSLANHPSARILQKFAVKSIPTAQP